MLRKLFRKAAAPNPPAPTFEVRAQHFWDWFSSRAQAFYDGIEEKNFDPYIDEISTKMNEILPGFAWVFGPGANNIGHSFTISPEGNPYEGILISHLLKKAPELEGWTFYGSRQPSPEFRTMKMDIAGETISAEQIWVTPSIDTEREKIDLVCWNPLFKDLPEKNRGQITFLWLDEALGEFQVSNRIGSIDIEDSALADAMPLAELPEFVDQTEKQQDWKPKVPGEYYTGYKFHEREEHIPDFVRSDIFYGTSLLWEVSRDFDRSQGDLEHPLPKLGVEYLFLKIPRSEMTRGKEVDERGELEDLITENFSRPASGICLGGASGHQFSYIDLLLTDRERGIEAIREALSDHRFGPSSTLHYFTKEKGSGSII